MSALWVSAKLAGFSSATSWRFPDASRVLINGERRSEDMAEVAITVREAGQCPMIVEAIAQRQALPKTTLSATDLDALTAEIAQMAPAAD
jgi:hypothetical protein